MSTCEKLENCPFYKGQLIVENDLEKVWNAYSRETGIDVQSLKTLLTKSETEKTWNELKKQGLDKYVLDNYKARITRLEQIKAQLYGKIKLLNQPEEKILNNGFKAVINNNYLKTRYAPRGAPNAKWVGAYPFWHYSRVHFYDSITFYFYNSIRKHT